MNVKIIPVTEKDAEDYSRLIKRVISNTPYYNTEAKKKEVAAYTPEKIIKRIANKNVLQLKATKDDQLIGFAVGSISAGMLHLGWIGVDSKFRRLGIAELLTRKVEEFVKKKKAHKVWLDTRTNNKQSVSLFKKLGYKKVALLKKHYYGLDYFIWEKLI